MSSFDSTLPKPLKIKERGGVSVMQNESNQNSITIKETSGKLKVSRIPKKLFMPNSSNAVINSGPTVMKRRLKSHDLNASKLGNLPQLTDIHVDRQHYNNSSIHTPPRQNLGGEP